MPNTYTPPQIGIAHDFAADDYYLTATSHGRTETVGPRILRGPGSLSVDIRHATKEAAEEAATRLRAYLASCGKPPKEKGEPVAQPRPIGHWEL